MKKPCIAAFLIFLTGIVLAEQLMVQLHDGRTLQVERTIEKTREFKIADPFFGLPIRPRMVDGGDITRLTFTNPDTMEIVHWASEPHYTPLLIDIIDKIPYLVVYGEISKETQATYGCPELPYFYLKYGTGGYSSNWQSIPVEQAPDVLRTANLPIEWRNDGGGMQKSIPRTYDDWKYEYKNSHRNERTFGDCRPPRESESPREPRKQSSQGQ